jgi:hypothetical protein
MAKKDKFAQMQQSGGAGSFQETLVQAAKTVAAIEHQQSATPSSSGEDGAELTAKPAAEPTTVQPTANSERFTHLANPWISMREYNLASNYCNSFDNMTRMDWMELAIIEKLHRDGQMPDDEFNARHTEITSRPPRGLRKNTKVQKNR